jgi:type II secretory pathway pseudopilin PulG
MYLMNMLRNNALRTRGMSFVEVLVAAAVIALVFGGLVAGFQYALILLTQTRAQTGALALANERIEYVRSLPYDSVGTALGIPSGTIPQNETVILNGITYNRRTFIQYEDSPADGLGVADTNGITADYKTAKVQVSWTQRGTSKSVILVTSIIPKGIESTAGGGTLVVNVFNAITAPIAGAAVRILNASATNPVDVTAYTDATGQVMFPGTPAGGGYQIIASKPGYSTAQTYTATTSDPNPNPANVAVVVSGVSTVNFAIDLTAVMAVKTVAPPSLYQASDTFTDASKLAAQSSTTVSGGAVVLTSASSSYAATGTVFATTTAPVGLISWNQARWSKALAANTSILISIYQVSASGTRSLVPDAVLPNNAAGFSSTTIDISGVSAAVYPKLALGATLTTTNASNTPQLLDWLLEYQAANVPIANVAFSLTGAKSIGTNGGGAAIPKYATTTTTNAVGTTTIANLEWDTYTASVNGYDISDVCPKIPMSVAPSESTTTTLVLSPHTANSLRVYVRSVSGSPLLGAQVRLTRSGYDVTNTTSGCGNAFFSGVSSASDYTLVTKAAGYQDDTLLNATVSGATSLNIPMAP